MDFNEKNSKLEIVWQDPNHRTNKELDQNQSTRQMLPEMQKQCDYPQSPAPRYSSPYIDEWATVNSISMAGVNQSTSTGTKLFVYEKST